MGFIRSLVFRTNLTSDLNVQNLKFQGKGHNIYRLVSRIEGFRIKFKLFEDALQI
jgi:hypothetical protein